MNLPIAWLRTALDYQSTKRIKFGPWYSDPESSPGSCRRLTEVVTEFGAQGLELDAVLLAWGTDLTVKDGRWSNRKARGYWAAHERDPYQLRLNAYRVLMTRGRDATVMHAAASRAGRDLRISGFRWFPNPLKNPNSERSWLPSALEETLS